MFLQVCCKTCDKNLNLLVLLICTEKQVEIVSVQFPVGYFKMTFSLVSQSVVFFD